MVWVIDESSIFELNSLTTHSVEEIGFSATKIVSVRNFYKNPGAVRDLVLRSPITRSKRIVKDYPSFGRVKMDLETDLFSNYIHKLIDEIYNVRMPTKEFLPFMANILLDNEKVNAGTCVKPHFDLGADFAAVLYLNLPDECAGGTGFYRHKSSSLEIAPSSDEIFSKKLTFGEYKKESPFFSKSDGNWELIHLAEMEYNKPVIYPARLFHSVYMLANDFKRNERINQVFFMSALGSNAC